jgi:peptidoglycan lytic transglycosylase G
VTGSDSPPNGSDRAARLRAEAARTDKAEPSTRARTGAAEKPPALPNQAPSAETQRARSAGAYATATAAPVTQQARAANGEKAVRNPSGTSANGAAAPLTASKRFPAITEATVARGSSSVREVSKSAPPAEEPYPPLTEGLVNGVGAVPPEAKNAKPVTPRSPRNALEPDKIEMPARRSKSARHPFVIVGNAIISVFVIAAIAVGAALVIGKQRFDEPGPLPEDRIVNIAHGSGIRDIADVLTREGVIDQPWVFVGGVLALKAREDLKAGEYQFKAHSSLRDVVATIVEGRVVMHQLTIPEGLTSEQMVGRLLDDDILSGNIKEIPREGSVLPDTYSFPRGLTREQIIQRMQQAQQRVLKEIWDHRAPDLPIKTPEQLVILASLVEKETGKPDERTRVAAVFVNRLKQKMRLQSDPTIIYGLVGGKGTLGRAILKSEVDQPTPYNTYQIDGLPPGPIANPGRASLEAAANPARTRELYFVADGTGGHAFAETYEQHQKNVARLRQNEAEQKDQAPAGAQLLATPPQPAQAAPAQAAPPPPPRRSSRRRQTP